MRRQHSPQTASAAGVISLTETIPLEVFVPGMVVGDECNLSFTRITLAGATPGLFTAVCATGKFTLTGQAGDTSTLAWRWRQ